MVIDEWATFEELRDKLKLKDASKDLKELVQSGFVEERNGSYRINDKDGKAMKRIGNFLEELETNHPERLTPEYQNQTLRVTRYTEPHQKLEYILINGTGEPMEKVPIHKEYLMETKDKFGDAKLVLNPKLHLFKINNTIASIFLNTKNKISVRKLPFKHILLSCDMILDGKRIQGIILTDFEKEDYDDRLWEEMNLTGEKFESWLPEMHVTYFVCPFDVIGGVSYGNRLKCKVGKFLFTRKTGSFETKIKEFVCNFVDFLDEPEVMTVVIERSPEQLKKRLKRGKLPTPTQAHIKLTGKLKEYVDSIETGMQKHFSHRFWLRGHWRHYHSKFYKNKLGQKTWIKPYIKGKGILLKKDYEVNS